MQLDEQEQTKSALALVAGSDEFYVGIAGLESDMKLVESEIERISFDDEIERYNWSYQIKRWLWHEKYYKGLAAYCRHFTPDRVLEIGTCTGASAVCLAKYCGYVVTSDITDWSVADLAIFRERISFNKCKLVTDALELDYTSFDLLFVDIDHSGLMERLIHQQLVEVGYVGDVFYDDIGVNVEMKRFWDRIKEPKLSLDWHDSGFGVVRYGGGKKR